MPYVNVRMVGKLTKEQKQKIAQEISETLFKIAHKSKKQTYIA
ncbi:MAG: tautomerase family protein, partial [Candidatus Omnitrophica bacterium]|nr:tautomerase family protein [Candidatus Omnitrophota bacterium]